MLSAGKQTDLDTQYADNGDEHKCVGFKQRPFDVCYHGEGGETTLYVSRRGAYFAVRETDGAFMPTATSKKGDDFRGASCSSRATAVSLPRRRPFFLKDCPKRKIMTDG
jgi:TPP-dependent indolepyruvate ferredoxin oxidoreductase alpha subunit